MKKAELEARVAELENILSRHYTHTCDHCGEVGLCEPITEYDGFEWRCVNAEACEQRYEERVLPTRKASWDAAPEWVRDYARRILEANTPPPPVTFEKGKTMEWRRSSAIKS